MSRNETIIAQLKQLMAEEYTPGDPRPSQKLQHDFSFLTSTPSAKALNVSASTSAQQPITTNTKFALSQIPALRSLLADLRPRLANLQSSSRRSDSARAERSEERREYIEQRTRMHLERNDIGVSANAHAVAGKRVEPEEVEALEKIVDTLDTH